MTLKFWEWLHMRREPWWKPLQKAIKAEFRGLDSERLVLERRPNLPGSASWGATDTQPGSLSDGDTPSMVVRQVLVTAQLTIGSRFLDLGSGRGYPALTAAALGFPSIGIELFPEYVEGCRKIALDLKLPAQFRQADLLRAEWPEADLYWLSSSAFTHGFRKELHERLNELPSGSYVVTMDWQLDAPYVLEQTSQLPVTWGVARFFYQRKP